ncbi:UNVERIFIED_CONTAM: hypothetical protein FKN15_060700 [Acipenser sinensis]
MAVWVGGGYPTVAATFVSLAVSVQVLSGDPSVLNVFASLLHTHLAGRGVRVGHYRNGEQIGFLGKNEHYDFNLQETMFLGSLVQVKACDEILVECTYNTESRKTATQGGLGTTNEMCLAFLLYYPRTKLASCWSLPDPTAMSTALGVKGKSELVALMNSSIWNDTAVGRFERTVRGLPQLMAVSVSNGTRTVDLGFIREFKSSPATACTTLPLSGGGESCALVTADLGLCIALLTSLISLTGAL